MKRDHSIFPYIVVLKQKYRFLVEIIGIIAGMIFILSLVIRIIEENTTRIINFPLLFVASALFIQQFLNYKKGKKVIFRYLFILAAISLSIVPPFQLLCLFFLLLAILEKPASSPEEIGFNDDQIIINGIFKRQISWDELTNVVLKDGIITLDFKSNKLIQKDTDDDDENEDYDVSEEEFNEFCQKMLNRHSNQQKTDLSPSM